MHVLFWQGYNVLPELGHELWRIVSRVNEIVRPENSRPIDDNKWSDHIQIAAQFSSGATNFCLAQEPRRVGLYSLQGTLAERSRPDQSSTLDYLFPMWFMISSFSRPVLMRPRQVVAVQNIAVV